MQAIYEAIRSAYLTGYHAGVFDVVWAIALAAIVTGAIGGIIALYICRNRKRNGKPKKRKR
jgi:uncharacterized membrane protein YjjB (DUF3815 family)